MFLYRASLTSNYYGPHTKDVLLSNNNQVNSRLNAVDIYNIHQQLLDNICVYIYSKSNLHAHMRIHTGQRPYSCDDCNQQFKQLSSLQAHTRIHTRQRPFRCDKTFRQLSTLEAHRRSHSGERPFSSTISALEVLLRECAI